MRHLVIGTAGHIDHGKSALVRALTGIDPDRLKEEKVRGITIDLGFAHERYGDVTFAFVDVPGHERFVKNMLAGASGIDCVLLVVAADESVMPQTREHFEICRLLHVPDGVVAITKCDLVDAETLELVRLEARELVSGSFLEAAPLIAVSAQTGQGLGELRRALAAVGARLPRRDAGGPVRLPIDRSFSIKGFGTVVTGTLASGRIEPEMDLRLLPSRRAAKVRNLQVHGEKQPVAVAGQRVAINLAGVDVAEIDRGDALIQPDTVTATRRLDARVELLPAAAPLKHGSRIRFHQGTSEVMGRAALGWAAGEEAGGAAPLSALAPGGDAYLRVHLERPAVLARGDRFILRAYSPAVTIAGGVVLDPQPVRGRMRTPAGHTRFRRLDAADKPGEGSADAIMAMVEEYGPAGMPVELLTTRAGVWPGHRAAVIGGLEQSGRIVQAGDRLVWQVAYLDLKRRLVAALEAHHGTHPLEEGMPREEARDRVARHAAASFDRVVAELVAEGRLAARDRLALAEHRISLSPEEERVRVAIDRLFRDAALHPPDPSTLAATVGASQEVTDRIVKLLVRERTLVRVDTLVFHGDALRRLKEEMLVLKQTQQGALRIDVATFKERYGVTRKFAIPLLEYLDRERVTRRVGDQRVVL